MDEQERRSDAEAEEAEPKASLTAQPFSAFRQVIDAELSNAGQ